jgi:hypothetical protein
VYIRGWFFNPFFSHGCDTDETRIRKAMMKGAWCLVRGAWFESVIICVYPWLGFSNPL